MFCEKCGSKLNENEEFCSNCGNVVDNNKSKNIDINTNIENTQFISNPNKKSKAPIIIILIILLVGIVGTVIFLNNRNNDGEDNPNSTNKNDTNNNQNVENNNDNNNNQFTINTDNLNNKVSSNDLNALKTAKLSEYFETRRNELYDAYNNYSYETHYEGEIGTNLNPIMFNIENGDLILYQLTKASAMTHQNYDCQSVECKSKKINLNNEKAKYISVNRNNLDYAISIMVLTENQNIYEGKIYGQSCESLECEYDVQLKKVETNYKFKAITQIMAYADVDYINYALTTNNELVSTSDLSLIYNLPLMVYSYGSIVPIYGYSVDIFPKIAIYENGTLGIMSYNKNNTTNNNKYYSILKDDGNKVVAKQILTANNCTTFILGIDNYLYKTNLNSCSSIINSDVTVTKYSNKIVKSIDYSEGTPDNNIQQMAIKQMRVVANSLNVSIQYEDGSIDLFQINRNSEQYTSGIKYIIFEN